MNSKKKEAILKVANLTISNLQKIFIVSFEEIIVVLDEESDIGSGYFKPKTEFKNKIFIVINYFEYKENLNKLVSKKVAHEFCHLYVYDKAYIQGKTFNYDIETELTRLILKFKITIQKDENNKYDISKLISKYAYENSVVNIWHEVLSEAFSLYFYYDYNKNEELLIKGAQAVHKGLVDFLKNYKVRDEKYIDKTDLGYIL